MPIERWRQYLLVKITGWTVDQIDATPAVELDWILAFHGLEVEIANENAEAQRKANR